MGRLTEAPSGKWTTQAKAALGTFLGTSADAIALPLNASTLDALRAAAADYEVKLTKPGILFDVAAARATSCNNLSPGRFSSTTSASDFPPIKAFDDSASIGDSAELNELTAWARALVVLSSMAGLEGNDQYGDAAASLLLSWAKADAGLKTKVDRRYLGAGNAGTYDAAAAAPVLDMKNATLLGATAYVATKLLGDRLSAPDRTLALHWADQLLAKYDASGSYLNGSTVGVYLDFYPALLRTVADGDDASYRKLVSALYSLFRHRVDKNGAILKNANRGDRALDYQSVGVEAMLSTFEVIENQGSKIPLDLEDKLHSAVTFLLDGTRDYRTVLSYAKMGFNNPGHGEHMEYNYLANSDHYWWMIDYIARYPNDSNSKRLRVLLADNDTSERVSSNIMAATWVPYPINCFKAFDLSDKTVAEDRAYVAAKFPAVELPPAPGFGKGMPKLSAAVPLLFDKATVAQSDDSPNFKSFVITLSNATAGEIGRGFSKFDVWTDFSGGDQPRNLQLFRVVLSLTDIGSDESAVAKYSSCGEVAANGSTVRLHIGNGAESNDCVLKKMNKDDRIYWSSVVAGLGAIIKAAPESAGRDKLKTLFQQMVY
jgi:hypothetical protein